MPNVVPVTDPIILDKTGQDIVDALNEIKEGVQPSNIYLDMEISIPTNGWSSTAPYTYTWLNSRITTECGVEVHFKDGAETIDMSYLEYEKTIGGITFTIDKIPNAAVPLVIRIINAKADAIIDATSADMVTTSAVPGASNVEEALGIHQTKVTENAEDITSLEEAMETANEEIAKRAKTLNGEPCDEYGDFSMREVEFARQLITDDAQQSTDEFLFRTTGGDASLTDGPAKLVSIHGRSVHTGEVAESLNMTVTMAERGQLDEPIEATIDRDIFVAYVDESGTTELTYTDSWSEDPADYGITVTGSPIDGDEITVVYVKGDRGTITNSNPSAFTSTGWNLYNNAAGVKYARVKKYSDTYGFIIGGSYSGIEFSPTLNGSRESITPASGYFTIPSDGYVFVSNGDDTTYILMTWSDWGEGYEGSFQNYSETTVSLSAIMTNFPYGLMQVGAIADEINFSMKRAISRIERLAYTEENLEAVIASGVAYDADENYIYAVKVTEDSYSITETGDYTASDHGIEFITGGTVPVFVQTLYGQNLVDKLRTDVLTKSNDLVNNLTTNDSNKALSAAQGYALNGNLEQIKPLYNDGNNWQHNVNVNSFKTSGVFEIGSSPTNAPNGWNYFHLLVLASGTPYINQLAIGNDRNVQQRFSSNDGSTWSAWEQVGQKSITYTITPTSNLFQNFEVNARSIGRIFIMDGAIRPTSDISTNTELAKIASLNMLFRLHTSSVASSLSNFVRLTCSTTGSFSCESTLKNDWYSFQMIGFLA